MFFCICLHFEVEIVKIINELQVALSSVQISHHPTRLGTGSSLKEMGLCFIQKFQSYVANKAIFW